MPLFLWISWEKEFLKSSNDWRLCFNFWALALEDLPEMGSWKQSTFLYDKKLKSNSSAISWMLEKGMPKLNSIEFWLLSEKAFLLEHTKNCVQNCPKKLMILTLKMRLQRFCGWIQSFEKFLFFCCRKKKELKNILNI